MVSGIMLQNRKELFKDVITARQKYESTMRTIAAAEKIRRSTTKRRRMLRESYSDINNLEDSVTKSKQFEIVQGS